MNRGSLPQRTPDRSADNRIRRTNLADADGGFDGFVPTEWIKGTGARIAAVLKAWGEGELAEVPAGRAWDVVRMELTRGTRTVSALHTAGATVGPVVRGVSHVDVLVPAGSVKGWDQDGATILDAGELLLVPHPAVVAPRTQRARSWIVPPGAAGLTDGTALYEAYAAASASMALDGTLLNHPRDSVGRA